MNKYTYRIYNLHIYIYLHICTYIYKYIPKYKYNITNVLSELIFVIRDVKIISPFLRDRRYVGTFSIRKCVQFLHPKIMSKLENTAHVFFQTSCKLKILPLL